MVLQSYSLQSISLALRTIHTAVTIFMIYMSIVMVCQWIITELFLLLIINK
jgi:hypothetical protein